MSLGRSALLLGSGTIVSRLTGLLRTIALIGFIGSNNSAVADAFFVANQLPNSIFNLISVGVLTAVVVPQIVTASKLADGGSAFISKMFTFGVVVLLVVTIVAMCVAPWLISLQIKADQPAQAALATSLAYWCLPQILFYGLYALVGESLNARGVFGPFTWAPVVNNVVSIIGFLVLAAVFGDNLVNVSDWTPGMVAALGGVATGGIFVQAVILLLFWPRARLDLKVDFGWRGAGLGDLGRVASWTLLMAIVTLCTGFFQTWVANEASGEGAAAAVMSNAWLVFMFPYSVVVLSVGTAYFTRLAEHASEGNLRLVRRDVGDSIRLLGLLTIGALAVLAAAAVPVSRVFTNTPADAIDAAVVLGAYLVCLVPLAVLFIVQRTFYALGDTRTPFWFTFLQCAIVIALTIAAWALNDAGVLPTGLLAAAVALGQSVASVVQTILAVMLLRRRIGPLGPSAWLTPLLRFTMAAVPAGALGLLVFQLVGGVQGWSVEGKVHGVLGGGVIAVTVLTLYVSLLALFRNREILSAVDLVRQRRRRSR